MTKLFSYTFIAVIALIAVSNVFNTVSTIIRLRRIELAMLRLVGMGHRSFHRMMRFESAFYGLWAMLYGLPIALVLSYTIQGTMMESLAEAGSTYRFPCFPLF